MNESSELRDALRKQRAVRLPSDTKEGSCFVVAIKFIFSMSIFIIGIFAVGSGPHGFVSFVICSGISIIFIIPSEVLKYKYLFLHVTTTGLCFWSSIWASKDPLSGMDSFLYQFSAFIITIPWMFIFGEMHNVNYFLPIFAAINGVVIFKYSK